MENKLRIFGKLFLAGLLTALLIALIYRDETFWQLRQPEGEKAKLTDIRILTQELSVSGGKGIDAQKLKEFWAAQSEGSEEYMNYGTYKELLGCLGQEKEDYLFDRKYRDEFILLNSDWYAVYDKLLAQMGLEDVIRCEKLFLLCGNDKIVGEKRLEDGGILADTGRICFPIAEELKEEHFTAIETYIHDDRLLTLVKRLPDEKKLSNVWVMESDDTSLQVFYEGYEILFPKENADCREQIADITFGEGALKELTVKDEKISGKLLSLGESTIEVEGHGSLVFAEDCKGYQLYDTLRQAAYGELSIGYDFADFVLEDGKVCAFLIARKEERKNIRVALKNHATGGLFHDEIAVSCAEGMTICFGEYENRQEEKIPAGEVLTIEKGSDYLKGDRLVMETAVNTGKIELLSQKRAQGIPAYRGSLELLATEDGIVIINELPLEEYLYSVVPSEMPASYPLEALKAQAICARTYGFRYLQHPGYQSYGAHVDDSVSYQVYNNIVENVNSTKAVKETAGTVLYYGDELVNVYYYSTSCGFGADAGVWNEDQKEEMPYLASRYIGAGETAKLSDEALSPASLSQEETFRAYIKAEDENAYEQAEAWFRWEYQVEDLDAAVISERLKERYLAGKDKILRYIGEQEEEPYQSEEPEKFKKIYDITCLKRKEGGVMEELLIDTDRGTYKVISEYNIRYVLNQGGHVVRQDGSESECGLLLPSAYFIIDTVKEDKNVVGYTIIGGGYGHGVGMSQNGARAMGLEGMSVEEILRFYFEECHLENAYG